MEIKMTDMMQDYIDNIPKPDRDYLDYLQRLDAARNKPAKLTLFLFQKAQQMWTEYGDVIEKHQNANMDKMFRGESFEFPAEYHKAWQEYMRLEKLLCL